jgi:hypothetical protein
MTFHVTFLSLKFKLSREFAKKEKKNNDKGMVRKLNTTDIPNF